MEDPNKLRVYKLFLKPIRNTEGQMDVEIGAYDTGELRGRVDFSNRKSLELVLYELEHPIRFLTPACEKWPSLLAKGRN